MKWFSRIFGPRSTGDLALIEGVSDHIAAWIGKPKVFHERVSRRIHLDIYWVPPSEDLPFHTLATSGMNEKPMSGPDSHRELYAELLMFLPPDWPMDQVTEDRDALWPIRIMKAVAGYPHEHQTWLAPVTRLNSEKLLDQAFPP